MEKQQQRKYKGGQQKRGQRPNKNKPINKKKPFKPKQQSAPSKFTSQSAPKPKGNEHLPQIKDMLQIPKQKRLQKTTEYFKKVRPFLEAFMQKKMGSRVVQLMFKWGNKQVKEQINKVILSGWKDLIKSKYALHSIATALSEYDFPKIIDDALLLQNNKQGSMLLQGYITKQPNAAVPILKKFSDIQKLAQEKGIQSQQPLHNLAMKSIQKSYYNNRISKHIIKLAFPTMVQEQLKKIVQFFSDKVFQLFTDDQGVKLFVLIYNYFDSKTKKSIIKQLDGRVNQVIHMCKISYVALIKIITQTDDTVVVGNKIIPQLLQLLTSPNTEMQDENPNTNENGQQAENNQPKNNRLLNVIISLLSPRNNNFNCLGKIQSNVPFTTCKKPEESRKQQIREFMYPTLTEYITSEENINKMVTDLHLSKIPLGVLKSMQSDSSQYLKDYATKMLKYFLADLENLKIQNSKKIKISQSLTAHNFGSKLLKNILLLQQTYIDKYCDKFAQIFKANLQETLRSNASFVLTILIQKGRNELIQEIKRSKIDVSKVKAGNFYMAQIKGKSK